MGYTTQFTGRIDLDRELTPDEYVTLLEFADERHQPGVDGAPGYNCDWTPTDNYRGIEWDGSEKFYSSEEWMQLIMDRFITPWGIKANGFILAQGEEAGDIWRLLVIDNRVERQNASVMFAASLPPSRLPHIDV